LRHGRSFPANEEFDVEPRHQPGRDELVDVVDEHDRVVDVVPRSRVRACNLRHRSVAIAVIGSDGRLLVNRRSEGKDIWPGMWDICVGGIVASGETYEVAAARELAEELGITDAGLRHIGAGPYEDGAVRLIGRCYLVVHDGPFRFVDGEVSEIRHVTASELDELAARAPFVPDSWTMVLPLLEGFGS
jgi:8-oxo-dGTP pyrophosphatase MutT (NUDIX family)